MLSIGCHLSASGGFLSMGQTALSIGANTFQFFTRNPRGSRAKAIDPADAQALVQLLREHDFGPLVAHAPYTINPCSKDEHTREFARMTMADDLLRMEYLPGNYYNFHPGSHTGQGAEIGIGQIADTLNAIVKPEQHTTVLLETMAGKGSEIGRNFEELAAIYEGVQYNDKLRVCFDTCHVHDAGYDIVHDFSGVMTQFDKVIGQDQIAVFHVNDSKNPCGAHKDRHENFGFGEIGFEALLQVVNCPDFEQIPKILETPYIPDPENKKKSYAPYKFEIEMIRKGGFDAQLKEKILQAAK